jgi:hypothetical protein
MQGCTLGWYQNVQKHAAMPYEALEKTLQRTILQVRGLASTDIMYLKCST